MTESRATFDDTSAHNPGGISRGLARLATAVLWAVVLGFGGALLYFIAVPGQRASGLVSFVFWYASPAVIVLTSAWALRAPIERRVGTALLLVSIMASAFAAEAVVRAFPRHVDGFPITTVEADSVCPGSPTGRRTAACSCSTGTTRPSIPPGSVTRKSCA
jgi:cytochrome bd-type quinol oxidase subunit 2